jgi:hypothetical protein
LFDRVHGAVRCHLEAGGQPLEGTVVFAWGRL